MSPRPIFTDLARRFALVIDGLCGATAARIAADRSAGPLLILIVGRLRRLAARFAALAARAQAGTLPRLRRPESGRRPPRGRQPRLPEGFAWLIRLVPQAAGYAGQVQALLSDPQMAALLEAAPQAGRVLRPLCRMLALPPDAAPPPPPPIQAARAASPVPEPTPATQATQATQATPPPGRAPPGVIWRRWRGIRMPEPRRTAAPA